MLRLILLVSAFALALLTGGCQYHSHVNHCDCPKAAKPGAGKDCKCGYGCGCKEDGKGCDKCAGCEGKKCPCCPPQDKQVMPPADDSDEQACLPPPGVQLVTMTLDDEADLARFVWIGADGKRRASDTTVTAFLAAPKDALDEVNEAREKRGLPAFRRDAGLTKAALACAKYRAERGIRGHANDFRFLPEGTTAKASGCGALSDDWGWAACCTYDRYSFAGAAWARGKGGLRYMQIFVR